MARLTVTVSRLRGLVTVTLDGELDRANANDVAAALRAAQRLATHTVVIDAQGITFVDVAGRRALDPAGHDHDAPQVILLSSPAILRFDRHAAHSTIRLQPHAA